MIIDGNEIEKRAMEEFHKGNRKEGLRIQGGIRRRFSDRVRAEGSLLLHKSMSLSWKLQGMRRHSQSPSGTCANCMRLMINKKIAVLSELTEHTFTTEK